MLADFAAELKGIIPELDILLAQKLVNSAWRNIRDSRLWSFLVSETYLYAPSVISAGTVTVTRLSTTVTADATAAAALNAVVLANPPLIQRQFRSGSAGKIYNIAGWTAPAGPLTLDIPYLEQSAVNTPYMVYRCYYSPPSVDFLRWLSVYDPDNGYPLKLDRMREEIDRRDPTRGSTGQAYYIANYKTDYVEGTSGSGMPRFELWPHPIDQAFVALYRRRGLDLVNATDDIPATLPQDVLMSRARWYSYKWAAANSARFPTLQGVNWYVMIADEGKAYLELLRDARKQDDNLLLQSLQLPQYASLATGPVDSSFLQSHDLGFVLGGE